MLRLVQQQGINCFLGFRSGGVGNRRLTTVSIGLVLHDQPDLLVGQRVMPGFAFITGILVDLTIAFWKFQ